ncbi:D-glycero-alpha-D-manno-heptose-1,7-bisphosphate 7-phosphatase [Williamwhitmania taraxaci]|uniref:D,D-heptose 1,7-bisphosphate phosphatase n=1 Tax=Williamwhitmania taraxaci TaxID=1640674 RepID=A0A1G6KDQ8_9BACT|nr:HAD family hydrolase [Williamwhitmania taraxaci]SDC29209.1 UDP-N-acetylmuramoyl-tripeptide--D-alanyl-D-alanine ligase/D-glycero-D-manno-heptose 1,7-bisphosphate phosphatase [Williamwhitmania taraxaci]
MQKAIFLDRDGVLNSDEGHYYVYRVDDLILNPGVIEALSALQEKGYLLIVVSNQGGVGRGEYTRQQVNAFHGKLEQILASARVKLTEIYYCPHHESTSKCLCRKPQPLMIEKAVARYNIDIKASFLIGDSPRDIEAAKAAGVKGILVKTNGNLLDGIKEIP